MSERRDGEQVVGAVAVIGAGIGGMQAALDLADGGFKVYLAEGGPAIGGTMAQLDKTFPTNDCAMCILSPKLVETGRHLNIDILTMAEVESISGQAGDFTLRLRLRPRYVDVKTCTGCGDCAAACPIERPDEFNAGLVTRKAIYKRYPQAIPNAFAIEKRGEAPCRAACPIEQRAMGYIALIREGRFADAYRTIREDNPFPSVCGRVCNHKCEEACSRAAAGDQAVSIMRLKRFVSDWARANLPSRFPAPAEAVARPDELSGQGEAGEQARVAVVGSGPAGLTCAADLARRGCAVTVFEALPVPGGMMRAGIPAYRLPYDELQSDIDDVLALGVQLKLNHRVEDARALLDQEGFAAVFVAVGAHAGIKLPIPGKELPEVLVATEFLRDVSLALTPGPSPTQREGLPERAAILALPDPVPGSGTGLPLPAGGDATHSGGEPDLPLSPSPCLRGRAELARGAGVAGRRVLVLGGGNVAIDAAMTALRLGASWVGMACLECRERMPAHDWEVRDAEEEGVALFPARTFKEIAGTPGHVTGVSMAQVDFRGFVDGRPDFDELPGTGELVPCDVVIFAIGQRPDLALLKGKVATTRGRTAAVDTETLATDVPGIFAGGDAVTGTAFVVDAIAAGHRAARGILAYLTAGGNPEAAAATSKTPVPRASPAPSLRSLRSGRRGGAGVAPERTSSRSEYDPERSEGAEWSAGASVAPRPQAAEAGASRPWPPVVRPAERPPSAELGLEEARRQIAQRPGPRAEAERRPAAGRRRDFGEVEAALTEEQARAEARRCLECGICSECLQCVYACRAGAVRHEDRGEAVELRVGGVILAPGLQTVPGDIRPEFGHGIYPNVVTSSEFERMLSASGPYAGVVQRPSDGAHPRKIAFIQCVGSRDASCGQDYCSSVCCMYATKEALIAREHDSRIEPAIFYMDIRAFGKGFERYCRRAEEQQGVRYVRSLVSCVKEVPGSRSLRVLYATPDGKSSEETFDLVVLSVGLRPADGTRALAVRLGVRLNRFGFAEGPQYGPAESNVPGIFVAGAFAAPKDIPETVIEASCAAARAARLLAPARGTLTRQPVYPQERDVAHEEPRVGVFVCHCGINIGGVVKVPEVVEHVRTLPNVVYAEHNLYTCSQDTQERIKQRIAEYGLNRVVVASCTPRTHEPLFQDTLRQAGLNPYLFELANIREQDSWVHRADRDVATEVARDVAAMAVAKAARLRPLYRQTLDMDHRALVAGGGLAGLTAALSLAEQGFEVHLVEREEALGGNLRHIFTALPAPAAAEGSPQTACSPQALLAGLIERVARDPRIHVYLGAEIVSVAGYVGQYKTTIRTSDGRTEELGHGAAILATGAQAVTPTQYLYGQHPAVITQQELEERLAGGSAPLRSGMIWQPPASVVMIQCVGSRDAEHPYCSRICCTQAIKNALALKTASPGTQVAILYRDIRTFGFHELLYRQARKAGVLFLEYGEKDPPKVWGTGVAAEGRLQVDLALQPDGERITLQPELVVLAAGIAPQAGNTALAQMFKVPLSEDGFFLEAHAKLRPLDFAADGVYLAGLAHSPRFIDETIAQANGAAARAAALLSRKQLQSSAITAAVNPRLCAACGLCVDVCPYSARVIDEERGHARVLEVLCQGCGACVAACPNGASYQRGFEFRQIFGIVDAALGEA